MQVRSVREDKGLKQALVQDCSRFYQNNKVILNYCQRQTMLLRLVFILLPAFANLVGDAQVLDEARFTRYTKLEGLSHNYITGIVQDSLGYVWIATNKGLNRFDGKSFTNFFKHSTNSPIPENLILSLRIQNSNEIIGTTVAGAFSYHTISRRRLHFIVPADSIIFFWANQGWQALKDQNGNYVVSTKTGLYVFNSGGQIICHYNHYRTQNAGQQELWFGNWLTTLSNGSIFQENNLSGSLYRPSLNQIDTLYSERGNDLRPLFNGKTGDERVSFPGRNDEVFVPNTASGTMVVRNLVKGHQYAAKISPLVLSDFDWYSKLYYLHDSLLAITSKVGGFYLFTYSPGRQHLVTNGKKYFAHRYCTSLFVDSESRLWIGTNDGLYKQNIRNSFFQAIDLSLQHPPIVNSGIESVFIASQKTFVGLGNEGGVLLLNSRTKKLERHINLSRFGEGSNTINFLFSYHPDTLWIGTGRGVLWLHLNNYSFGRLNVPGQPHWMYRTRTRTYLKDSEGNIWLSFGEINSLVMFDRSRYQFFDFTKAPLLRITFCFTMAEDKNHNVWFAGDGLSRWNRRTNQIDTLIPYPPVNQSLFNYMLLLDCDDSNNLWISSFDNEILQYNINQNRMYLRVGENSMIDGYTVTNSQVIRDHIWLGMINGISAFNVKNFSVKQFNYADGLPSAVATSKRKGSFYDELEDRFYFGAGHYLISFRPDITLSYKQLPRFSLELQGEDKILSGNIQLPYSHNDIELRLNVINFTDPEENRYAYRFQNGADTSWRELHTKNVLVLSQLAPGQHQIQVKLYSVNNRWPFQVKTLHLQINPPFWRTPWFISLTALFLLSVSYYLHRKRVRQVQQKANLDKLLAQTEMKALHSQMNPHFIFNCLNSIREMILNHENTQASRYLSKFAQLIRMTLDHSSKPVVSLRQTVDHIHRYLEMEQIRTSTFHYKISIDEQSDPNEILLPPMLIQPFIENAIWHGHSYKEPMELQICFHQRDQQLLCVIDDTGIGIEASLKNKSGMQVKHTSVGIENIRKRIQVLNEKYNIDCSLIIEDKKHRQSAEGTGTTVTLKLPIKNVFQQL
jgi:ligand-binding sensor domain-containing protein